MQPRLYKDSGGPHFLIPHWASRETGVAAM
jgi:hypothetical protein